MEEVGRSFSSVVSRTEKYDQHLVVAHPSIFQNPNTSLKRNEVLEELKSLARNIESCTKMIGSALTELKDTVSKQGEVISKQGEVISKQGESIQDLQNERFEIQTFVLQRDIVLKVMNNAKLVAYLNGEVNLIDLAPADCDLVAALQSICKNEEFLIEVRDADGTETERPVRDVKELLGEVRKLLLGFSHAAHKREYPVDETLRNFEKLIALETSSHQRNLAIAATVGLVCAKRLAVSAPDKNNILSLKRSK
jgi:hypothetical protein